MRRNAIALATLLASTACHDHPATALVVAITSEPRIPEDVDTLRISAIRDGEPKFQADYDIAADRVIPGTLTLQGKRGEGEVVEIVLQGKRRGDAKVRLDRRARVRLVDDRTKLLRVRFENACLDETGCPAGETCLAGVCASEDVDGESLPDFESNEAALAGASGSGGESGVGGAGGMAGAAGEAGTSGTAGASGGGGAGAGGSGGGSGSGGSSGGGGAGMSGSSGQGGSAVCTPNAATCSGNVQQTCWPNGAGVTSLDCGVATCTDGRCVTGKILHVDVADEHACVLEMDGSVWCWGGSSQWNLGTTQVDTSIPAQVQGIPQMKTLAGGYDFSCGVATDGNVWCWGKGYFDELGVSGATGPTMVPGTAGVVETVGGALSTCARFGDGHVACWGQNDSGSLGTPPGMPPMSTPVDVVLPAPAVRLFGHDPVCAIHADGTATCWGFFLPGPTPLAGVTDAVEVLAPSTGTGLVFVREASGKIVWFLADGKGGITGPNDVDPSYEPAAQIAADYDLCVLRPDGSVACGFADIAGPEPATEVVGPGTAVELSAGDSDESPKVGVKCIRKTDGTVACWGNDRHGYLGIGLPFVSGTPADVTGPTNATELSTSVWASAAMTPAGAFAWGDNEPLALSYQATPAIVTTPVNAVHVRLDESPYTYFFDAGGTVTAFSNGVPSAGSGLAGVATKWLDVFASSHFDGGIQSDGTIAFVPHFDLTTTVGEFGVPNATFPAGMPVVPTSLASVSKIASFQGVQDETSHHLCAISAAAVFCWGDASKGQIGDGNMPPYVDTPTQVSTLPPATDVCVGTTHSCAVAGGSVYCWGDGFFGQIGQGTGVSSATPMQVSLPDVAVGIACGATSTCAWLMNGDAWCWGANELGQLGIGTIGSPVGPTKMLLSNVSAVSLSIEHGCAIHGGTVACFGSGFGGRRGSGPNGLYDTPQTVLLP